MGFDGISRGVLDKEISTGIDSPFGRGKIAGGLFCLIFEVG